MTLEELHNLVSELHERHPDETLILVAAKYQGPLEPKEVIAGHYEPAGGSHIVLVLDKLPDTDE